MMVDGVPNRPIYFYQKDIIADIPTDTPQSHTKLRHKNTTRAPYGMAAGSRR